LRVLARGSLTAIRYRDEIVRPLVRPHAGAVGPGFLLMQDNARPHVAGVCQQFLQDEGIEAIDWPARSPGLNPIEHFWDIMSRSIQSVSAVSAPQTVQELADALVQVWEEIPQETIRHLISERPLFSLGLLSWLTPYRLSWFSPGDLWLLALALSLGHYSFHAGHYSFHAGHYSIMQDTIASSQDTTASMQDTTASMQDTTASCRTL
ncbi:hypothetical protein NFI96_000581, partial [Prochilodus magdalenae]